MIHHYIDLSPDSISGAHWAAGQNGQGGVIAQLGDEQGEQVRVVLTPEQADEFAAKLNESARIARGQFS